MTSNLKDLSADKLYDHIYKIPNSKGGFYGLVNRRAGIFVDYMKDMERGSVFEIGCGRGNLIRWLRKLGFTVEGTEIADCLFDDDLVGLPVCKMFCSELGQIADGSFDYVLSSDVIEHLDTEQEAVDLMAHMARISRKHVLLSTGGTKCATSMGIGLHNVVKPKEWWIELFKKYCTLKKYSEGAGSIFLFGEK